MAATLPVPIAFRLPNDQWQAVDPEAYGVVNALFLAIRQTDDDYSPTLTLSGGERDDDSSMEQIGDEAVSVFAQQAEDVELVTRRDYGSSDSPGLLQVVGGTLAVEGRTFDLRQAHVLWGITDTQDRQRRVVLKVVLSTTYKQFETYLPELQDFVASIHPDTDAPTA